MALTNDYGVHVPRPSNLLRLLTLLTTWLHFTSTVIVLGISAYFIAQYSNTRNTHLIYWLTISCIDTTLLLPYLAYPFFTPLALFTRLLQPLQWVFSYLWLTTFIFASQDYDFNGTCARSPSGVDKCGLKRTLEAFAFLAFFASVLGQVIESKMFGLMAAKTETPVVEKPVEPVGAPNPESSAV
jgi:hypothetical protein